MTWRARARRLAVLAGLACFAAGASAHVGSPDTIWEGMAGAYPLRVIIRDPGVIPGQAEIVVRSRGPGVERVTVTATVWNAEGGAPPPERAERVPGDSTFWSAHLWFMTASSYGVQVHLDGQAGSGDAVIPFVARATRVTPLPVPLGAVLSALALLLVAGVVTIVFAAVRESALPAGETVDAHRQRRALISGAVALVVVLAMLLGGKRWWASEAGSYAAGVLSTQPFHLEARVSLRDSIATLVLDIDDPVWRDTASRHQNAARRGRWTPLMPDHGRLMHAFLVADAGDGFAHLHPVSADSMTFAAPLPLLPAGRYHLFADIVHESGWSQTLTAAVTLPAGLARGVTADSEDAWTTAPAASDTIADLGDGIRMIFRGGPLVAGQDLSLAFSVMHPDSGVLTVEPYLGMAGHLALVRDSTIFMHLHPAGTVSMAATERLTARLAGDSTMAEHLPGTMPGRFAGNLHFPYLFPAPGAYRIWVQVKVGGRVRTAGFRMQVSSPEKAMHP